MSMEASNFTHNSSLLSDRLLRATPDADDAARLVQAAGKAHIPINPSGSFFDKKGPAPVQLDERPAIDAVVAEVQEQAWYKGQIVENRIFNATERKTGERFAYQ
jgi:DEAD/DEAH box helicase domain-containing protein